VISWATTQAASGVVPEGVEVIRRSVTGVRCEVSGGLVAVEVAVGIVVSVGGGGVDVDDEVGLDGSGQVGSGVVSPGWKGVRVGTFSAVTR
jgi:hypothetical protein